MRLDFWNRRDECACAAAPAAPPPPCENGVSAMSPARLLADSLTNPETRGEWVRTSARAMYGCAWDYENKPRKLSVSRGFSLNIYSSAEWIRTPFTLTDAEQKIVKAALGRFDRHLRDEQERDALARLTAPREGLQRDSGETAKTGSTRRAKARPARARQSDAQTPSVIQSKENGG